MPNDLIWDGEVNCSWIELSKLLLATCREFTKTMLETVSFSPNVESRSLISKEGMIRFESLTEVLAKIIESGEYYADEDLFRNQSALKLNGWIVLGSLTETTLQIFLAFYMDDYKRSNWKQWDAFQAEPVKRLISQSIQDMVKNGYLDQSQAKSLKCAVNDKIKKHTREHKVEKIMLDELVQFYSELNLLDNDDIQELKTIQSNRNGIHSFQDRDLGDWTELKHSTRFFCYLLKWVLFHLPEIPTE